MLFLFEAGGLHPRMAYVLDGEPASTSRKPALVLARLIRERTHERLASVV